MLELKEMTDLQYKKIRFYADIKGEALKYSKYDSLDNDPSTRFFNGAIGECLITEYLGFNWSPFNYGNGLLNNFPDLMPYNLNLGIKTAKVGFAHRIPTLIHSDELLCDLLKPENYVRLLGVLTQENLDIYGDKNLLCGDLRTSGKEKTGFNRYDVLMSINKEFLFENYLVNLTSGDSMKYEGEYLYTDSVYLELVNENTLGYCIISDNRISSPNFMSYYYKPLMDGRYDRNKIKYLIELCKNKRVITFGNSGLIQQLKSINEKYFKICGHIVIVDIFEMMNRLSWEWSRIMELNSVKDYARATEFNINNLLNTLKVDIKKIDMPYLTGNAYKCLTLYEKLSEKLYVNEKNKNFS